jgi:hypothetical protein
MRGPGLREGLALFLYLTVGGRARLGCWVRDLRPSSLNMVPDTKLIPIGVEEVGKYWAWIGVSWVFDVMEAFINLVPDTRLMD